MKVISIVSIMVSIFFGAVEKELPSVLEEECTLSITGYANAPGMGRAKMTLSASASTCEEAADMLRPSIIDMQLTIK